MGSSSQDHSFPDLLMYLFISLRHWLGCEHPLFLLLPHCDSIQDGLHGFCIQLQCDWGSGCLWLHCAVSLYGIQCWRWISQVTPPNGVAGEWIVVNSDNDMVSRVGIPETALQLPTLVLKILVLLNDSYTHEELKVNLHVLLDGIDHHSVFVIAWLSILTYFCISFQEKWLIEISKSQQRGLKTSPLKHLKGTQSFFHECYLLVLLADTFPR